MRHLQRHSYRKSQRWFHATVVSRRIQSVALNSFLRYARALNIFIENSFYFRSCFYSHVHIEIGNASEMTIMMTNVRILTLVLSGHWEFRQHTRVGIHPQNYYFNRPFCKEKKRLYEFHPAFYVPYLMPKNLYFKNRSFLRNACLFFMCIKVIFVYNYSITFHFQLWLVFSFCDVQPSCKENVLLRTNL